MIVTVTDESIRWLAGLFVSLEVWQVKQLFSVQTQIKLINARLDGENATTKTKKAAMKHKLLNSIFITSLLLLVLLYATSGCVGTPGKAPPLLTQTASITNADGTIYPVYGPNPSLVTGIDTAKGVGSLLPPPISTVAVPALGLLSAVLGFYVRQSNARAKTNADALDTASSALQAAVAGIEASGSASVKNLVASHAAAAGVGEFLDSVVQDVSRSMPDSSTKP